MPTKHLQAKTKKAPLVKEEPSEVLPITVLPKPSPNSGGRKYGGWFGDWVRKGNKFVPPKR